jgi:hypothetical protein
MKHITIQFQIGGVRKLIKFRLAFEMESNKPIYSIDEIWEKVFNGTAKFEKNKTGTIFLLDTEMNNRIMAGSIKKYEKE